MVYAHGKEIEIGIHVGHSYRLTKAIISTAGKGKILFWSKFRPRCYLCQCTLRRILQYHNTFIANPDE